MKTHKLHRFSYFKIPDAHGRWAPFLLPGYFGRYQNVLRIILIDSASLVTAPKEARPQELISNKYQTHYSKIN